MKKWNDKFAIYIWLIILTIIGVASLVRSFYHDIMLQIDYSGILVGILGALCTVLIGWQIYSIIDFNQRERKNQKKIEKLQQIIKDIRENGNRGDYLIYDYFSDIYSNLLSNNESNCQFELIHFKINAIVYASRILEFEVCEIGIDIIDCFIRENHPLFDQEQKNRLLTYACSIPNQDRIKNYVKLINAISLIKTEK